MVTTEELVELRASGMDCQSCAVVIEAGLSQLNGVGAVQVDVEAGLVRARYDPGCTTPQEMEARLAELGFAAGGEPAGRPLVPAPLIIAALALALPLLVVFRDVAAYAPNAVYAPSGLTPGRFDQVALLPIGLAFLLGVLVFFSPTIIAMSSVVVGYAASSGGHSRASALRTAAGFALGIVVIDALVGALFGALGKGAILFFTARLPAWNLLVGLTLGVTGLILLGVWKLELPGFAHKLRGVRGFTGALFVGAPFALLDCPGCTPLLLPVALGAAASGEPLYGAALLGAYGMGRGVLLMTLGASTGFAKRARGFRRHQAVVEAVSGAVVLAAGLYFVKEFLRLSLIG